MTTATQAECEALMRDIEKAMALIQGREPTSRQEIASRTERLKKVAKYRGPSDTSPTADSHRVLRRRCVGQRSAWASLPRACPTCSPKIPGTCSGSCFGDLAVSVARGDLTAPRCLLIRRSARAPVTMSAMISAACDSTTSGNSVLSLSISSTVLYGGRFFAARRLFSRSSRSFSSLRALFLARLQVQRHAVSARAPCRWRRCRTPASDSQDPSVRGYPHRTSTSRPAASSHSPRSPGKARPAIRSHGRAASRALSPTSFMSMGEGSGTSGSTPRCCVLSPVTR